MHANYNCHLDVNEMFQESSELFTLFERILNSPKEYDEEETKLLCVEYFQKSKVYLTIYLNKFIKSFSDAGREGQRRERITKELNLILFYIENVDLANQSSEISVLICCLMNNMVNTISLRTASLIGTLPNGDANLKKLTEFYKKGCKILSLGWWRHLNLLIKMAKIIFNLIQKTNMNDVNISDFIILLFSLIKDNKSAVKADKSLLAYWEYAQKVSNKKEDTPIIKNYGLGFKVHNDLGNSRHKNKVVIAFSASTNGWHWLNNLTQLTGYSYLYIVAAGYLCIEMDKAHTAKEFKVCGHSLGGGLAQFSVAANTEKHEGQSLEAICYNSAGLSEEMYNLLNANLVFPIVHVFTQKDLVHNLGFLLGKLYVLDFPCKSYLHICYNHDKRIFNDYLTSIQNS